MSKCKACRRGKHNDCQAPHGNDSSGKWIIYCCCGIEINDVTSVVHVDDPKSPKRLSIGIVYGMEIILQGKALESYEKMSDENKEKFRKATLEAMKIRIENMEAEVGE